MQPSCLLSASLDLLDCLLSCKCQSLLPAAAHILPPQMLPQGPEKGCSMKQAGASQKCLISPMAYCLLHILWETKYPTSMACIKFANGLLPVIGMAITHSSCLAEEVSSLGVQAEVIHISVSHIAQDLHGRMSCHWKVLSVGCSNSQ